MYPNIDCGETVAVNLKYDYMPIKKERGDIISFKEKPEDERGLQKRIIGLPGEKIEIKNQVIYINDSILKEEYLNKEIRLLQYSLFGNYNEDYDEIILGSDEYFMLGDNRMDSLDSVELGPIQEKDIEELNLFQIW